MASAGTYLYLTTCHSKKAKRVKQLRLARSLARSFACLCVRALLVAVLVLRGPTIGLPTSPHLALTYL